MKKTLTLIVLLQLGIITGATENFTRDGINVILIKEANVCGPTDHSQSISADITGNTLTITFNEKEGNGDIVIYNALGIVVKQSHINEGENIINAEDLKAGVYIWKLTSDSKTINSGKFIKK